MKKVKQRGAFPFVSTKFYILDDFKDYKENKGLIRKGIFHDWHHQYLLKNVEITDVSQNHPKRFALTMETKDHMELHGTFPCCIAQERELYSSPVPLRIPKKGDVVTIGGYLFELEDENLNIRSLKYQ